MNRLHMLTVKSPKMMAGGKPWFAMSLGSQGEVDGSSLVAVMRNKRGMIHIGADLLPEGEREKIWTAALGNKHPSLMYSAEWVLDPERLQGRQGVGRD